MGSVYIETYSASNSLCVALVQFCLDRDHNLLDFCIVVDGENFTRFEPTS